MYHTSNAYGRWGPKALEKIAKKDKRNAEYMKNLSAQVDEKLGENKELLRPMFEHIKIQETDKKTNLTYDTIVF